MNNIRLILVSPKYSGNVGACARVAANFGVSDIYVVAPGCDIYDDQAKMYGKGPAREYLLNMKIVPTLLDAIGDCAQAVAITRRLGDLSPEEISFAKLPEVSLKEKTAIVFGREDNCLTREETNLCTYSCYIPTTNVMPTLNLSHAVSVVMSKLYTDAIPNNFKKGPETEKANIKEVQDMLVQWQGVAVKAGFTKGGDPEKLMNRIRRLMQKTRPNVKELAQVRRFLGKISIKL